MVSNKQSCINIHTPWDYILIDKLCVIKRNSNQSNLFEYNTINIMFLLILHTFEYNTLRNKEIIYTYSSTFKELNKGCHGIIFEV